MGTMHKTDAVPPSVQQIVDAIVGCEASGDELREMIVSALAEARREGARGPSSAWQPIETAPKDTEVFIGAFIDEEFHFGRSVLFYEQGNEFAGETWSGWVWSIDDCSESVAESPTHWMPIPAAPSPI